MLILNTETFKERNRTLCCLKGTFLFSGTHHRCSDIGKRDRLLIFPSVGPVDIQSLEKKSLGLCKFTLFLVKKSLVIVKARIEHIVCLERHRIYLLNFMIDAP